jgi:hypothetical protein
MNKKDLIELYVDGWRNNDKEKILSSLSSDAIVIESHGPLYRGIEKVGEWIDFWITEGSIVNSWDITSFVETEDAVYFEWIFECTVKGKVHTIEGISVVKFENNKIKYIREYKTSEPVFEWKK